MKDKDFGYVLVLLVLIIWGKDIKNYAAKKLGMDEPVELAPAGQLWSTTAIEPWRPITPSSPGGLFNQERRPGSQAARLLEELTPVEPKTANPPLNTLESDQPVEDLGLLFKPSPALAAESVQP